MNTNIILTPVPLDTLLSMFSDIVDQKIQSAHALSNPVVPTDSLLSRKEAAALLGISLNTLNGWTKNGKVVGYRIASRVRYKKNELEASLTKINTPKGLMLYSQKR